MTRLLVAIPMKDQADAKTRISGCCAPDGREALVLHLLGQTVEKLRAAKRLGAVFDIAIVTTSPRIRGCALKDGLETIADLGIGLSGAAASARAWAEAKGYDALCIVPGDLADPTPQDLAVLLAQPTEGRITLCAALDMGTNAMLMPLPNRIAFQYGAESFHRHRRAALRAGLEPRTLLLPSLRRDVDRMADLAFLPPAARRACHLDAPYAPDDHADRAR